MFFDQSLFLPLFLFFLYLTHSILFSILHFLFFSVFSFSFSLISISLSLISLFLSSISSIILEKLVSSVFKSAIVAGTPKEDTLTSAGALRVGAVPAARI
jgi:hypothetical protein